jgi:hypothetical protein
LRIPNDQASSNHVIIAYSSALTEEQTHVLIANPLIHASHLKEMLEIYFK